MGQGAHGGRDEEFQRVIREAGLAGGKMVGGPEMQVVGMPPPTHRTQRQVILRGCQLNMQVITDEVAESGEDAEIEVKDVVQGYQLMITDPHENILYLFKFNDQVREIVDTFAGLPHIGEVMPDPEDLGLQGEAPEE